jgi:hypothetical protein
LFLNFASGYATRKVKRKQERLKLNGTYFLLGGNMKEIKKNAEAPREARNLCTEKGTEKNKYIIIFNVSHFVHYLYN